MSTDDDLFKQLYRQHRRIAIEDLKNVFDPSIDAENITVSGFELYKEEDVWRCHSLPGLQIIRKFLSTDEQKTLLKETLIDFLIPPGHLTNLDAHHEIVRPIKLFRSEKAEVLPKLNLKRTPLIRDKLRWITLGGQYNWTEKVYPSFEKGSPGCPDFPQSFAKVVAERFNCIPEAAIVNYYSDGDILSPHQDVAELTKKDLVSISIGCSCVFYLALERYGSQVLPIILRSGDVVIMGGESRFAFHGVGRVFKGTCPIELAGHDVIDDDDFAEWVMDHRINVNIRQMK